MTACPQWLRGSSIMSHWGRRRKSFVKKKCKGILTISIQCWAYRHEKYFARRTGTDCYPVSDYGVGGFWLHNAAKRLQAIFTRVSGDCALCSDPCFSVGQYFNQNSVDYLPSVLSCVYGAEKRIFRCTGHKLNLLYLCGECNYPALWYCRICVP